jgi:hypothetical protein
MEKTLSYLKRYLRYEKPTDEEAKAITGYIRSRASSMIQGRSKEDLDDLPAKFIAEGLPVWRRKHPGLLKLSDQDLWNRFTWTVFEFLFEERDKWAKEKRGQVCDAGMITDRERPGDEVGLGQLRPVIPDEVLEDMEKTRSQFQRALGSHPAAGEYVDTQGTPCARLARRVLSQVYRHERTPEEALELLSVVLESNELKFKERSKRLALFLAVLGEYEKFDYQSYTEASPVTMYPSCGMSETPRMIPALSDEQVEALSHRYGLNQRELADIFDFDPTDVPGMKSRKTSGIQQEEESLALEKEAESVLEARRAKIWESFEAVLMVKFRI